HLVMLSVSNVSYIRRFGYFSLVDTLQGVFFPYIILGKIATSNDKILPETNWANSKQTGDREWGDHLALFLALPVIGHVIALGISAVTRAQPGKKTKVKEWGDSILFALVAASIIRTYVFEPFRIPTGSMEKTLLVGDFLFVNKLAYGPKVPVTPLSYPLVHNTVPWVNIKSYTGLETSDYTRIPGIGNVERYDVVVFNYPSGDTSIYDPRMPHGLMGHDYHQVLNDEALYMWCEDVLNRNARKLVPKYGRNVRNLTNTYVDNNEFLAENGHNFLENIELWKSKARERLANGFTYSRGGMPEKKINHIEHYGLIPRPVDKRENYIKRCVGIPGDFIEIKESILYVNDKPARIAYNQNLQYIVSGVSSYSVNFMEEIKMESSKKRGDYVSLSKDIYQMNITDWQKKAIEAEYPDARFELVLNPQYSDNDSILPTSYDKIKNLGKFPKDPNINNTTTDFTRFQLPKKGQTISINKENIAWYRRVIGVYEGHKLQEKSDGIYIDGKKTSKYTFAMNYYWLMGDNRYNSADSRVWGFVPEDHIVGKASLVWMSNDPFGGFRWGRMFTWIE
ncbi:MAG: signal peptidase I, partial [Crocinitomicaceae bacterium]|nr:signal peptidase I [Crocinitomicaceae bacterium]